MKIDCNITENFLKEWSRFCKTSVDCYGCDLKCSCWKYSSVKLSSQNSIKFISAIKSWSDEHSQKTYLEDLKEKYPNADFGYKCRPANCPSSFGYSDFDCDGTQLYTSHKNEKLDCEACWDQLIK